MKKIFIVIIAIGLIIVLGLEIKNYLEISNEIQENTLSKELTQADYEAAGWEVESEYSFNGTIESNELQEMGNAIDEK